MQRIQTPPTDRLHRHPTQRVCVEDSLLPIFLAADEWPSEHHAASQTWISAVHASSKQQKIFFELADFEAKLAGRQQCGEADA